MQTDTPHLLTRRESVVCYGWIVGGCLLWCVVLLALSGCKAGLGIPNPFSVFGPSKPPPGSAPTPADPFWFLPWIAGMCAAFAVAALIASVFVPLIPRKAAFVAIGCAVGAGLLKAFLTKFLGVMLWGAFGLLVVGGLFALWPFLCGARNWSINRLGWKLATNGHKDAGVALMSAARGLVKAKHKDARAALVAAVNPTVEHQPV